MDDIQTRIEELEKRALENDLMSLLATTEDAQQRTAQHARECRLAALRLKTRRE
jgi:hypothetical protein